MIQLIAPCLWFDGQAEEAARFYISIFKNSEIKNISYFPKAGYEVHEQKAGSVMTVDFVLDGQIFTALNGGSLFKFNEAVSFQVLCESQHEVDYYWQHLSEGGEEGPCGWLKDKFGLSWQIVPNAFIELMKNPEKAEIAFAAMMGMTKIDMDKIQELVK
ncbi:MAG: VOC family protein [Dysgonomonas sp.]